jgi:hypothetical protein
MGFPSGYFWIFMILIDNFKGDRVAKKPDFSEKCLLPDQPLHRNRVSVSSKS